MYSTVRKVRCSIGCVLCDKLKAGFRGNSNDGQTQRLQMRTPSQIPVFEFFDPLSLPVIYVWVSLCRETINIIRSLAYSPISSSLYKYFATQQERQWYDSTSILKFCIGRKMWFLAFYSSWRGTNGV